MKTHKRRLSPLAALLPLLAIYFSINSQLFADFSITEIKVNHRPREFGVSKYGGNRFFHGFFDLFTMLFTSKYFDRPLHFFGSVGLLFILISLGCEVFSLFDKIINGIPFQTHFALIVLGAMIFVLGLWFFSIGY